MTDTESVTVLTKEEQATLKTALAFCVLRQAARKTCTSPEISFCRNLLNSSRPLEAICDNQGHVQHMLPLALAVAEPVYGKHTVYSMASPQTRLQAIASNMARHLGGSFENHAADWVLAWMQTSTLNHPIQPICALWHSMAQESPTTVPILLRMVSQLLRQIYHDQVVVTCDSDTLVVNLVFLLEALLSMHPTTLNEFWQIMDQTLTLPVENMPAFVHSHGNSKNLSAPSKMLLHLALYNLTLELTNTTTH